MINIVSDMQSMTGVKVKSKADQILTKDFIRHLNQTC